MKIMKSIDGMRLSVLCSILMLFLTSCNDTGDVQNEYEDAVTETEVTAEEANVNMQNTARLETRTNEKLGTYLTDADGRSLYLFKADSAMNSNCYDACAEAWPPYSPESIPAAGEGVNASLIDTIQRRTGEMQVTYNGWPLYYYVKDQGAGQTTGQDVMGFGAEWYLLTPEGKELEAH